MDVTKLYKSMRFGSMDVTKPYKSIRFGPWMAQTFHNVIKCPDISQHDKMPRHFTA